MESMADEVFEISRIDRKMRVPTYYLRGLLPPKEELESKWFEFELSPISKNSEFHMDKIVKREKNFVTISFIGLPPSITQRIRKSSATKARKFKPLLRLAVDSK